MVCNKLNKYFEGVTTFLSLITMATLMPLSQKVKMDNCSL